MITESNQDAIKDKIDQLRVEHRDLDDVLTQLANNLHTDQLQIQRLKKRKLHLKDTITRLESELLPDITA